MNKLENKIKIIPANIEPGNQVPATIIFEDAHEITRLPHTGKFKSTGGGCKALVQTKLRTGVRLKLK